MRRPAKNAAFLSAGEVGARLFGFLASALLARRLGIEGFGRLGFAMSVLAYGVMLSNFGILTVGIRAAARDRDSIPRLAANILGIRLLLALVAMLSIAAFAFAGTRSTSARWLVIAFSLGVVLQSLLLDWVFTGIERMGSIALAQVLTNTVYFVLVVALVDGPSRILAVPLAFAVASLAGCTVLLVPYIKNFGWPWPRFERQVWISLARQAWPIGVASVLIQLHANLAVVCLALLRSDLETGAFNAALRLVLFALTFDRMFQALSLPVLSRHFKASSPRLPELTGTALKVILAVGLPVCAATVLLAGPVVSFVFGPEYRQSAGVLRVLVWFFPMSLMSTLAGVSLLAANQEVRYAHNAALGVVASFVLNVAGALLAGPVGAAAAMVAGEACILAFMARDFLSRVRPKLTWRTAAPILAAVPMVVLILLLRRWGWAFAAVAGGCSYVATLLLARGLGPEEIGLAGGVKSESQHLCSAGIELRQSSESGSGEAGARIPVQEPDEGKSE